MTGDSGNAIGGAVGLSLRTGIAARRLGDDVLSESDWRRVRAPRLGSGPDLDGPAGARAYLAAEALRLAECPTTDAGSQAALLGAFARGFDAALRAVNGILAELVGEGLAEPERLAPAPRRRHVADVPGKELWRDGPYPASAGGHEGPGTDG